MSTLGVNNHVVVNDNKDANPNKMDGLIGLTGMAFTVANSSLKPPQAIAVLSAAAADTVKDEFNGFTRVKEGGGIKNRYIHIGNTSYGLENNKVFTETDPPTGTGHWDTDANILMYKKSDAEYMLQVDGKLIHIKDVNNITNKGYIQIAGRVIYDSQTKLDEFIAFAEKMGLDEYTVLGAKIILKLLMSNMNYDMKKLDETFMNPQADYLAFVNQTLSPIIEAGLTATMSGLKSSIEFLKKIIQKAGS